SSLTCHFRKRASMLRLTVMDTSLGGAIGGLAPTVAALIRSLCVEGNCFANKATKKIRICLFDGHIYRPDTFRYMFVIVRSEADQDRSGRIDWLSTASSTAAT